MRDGSHGSQEGVFPHRVVLRDRWRRQVLQTMEDRGGQRRGNFLSRDEKAKGAAEVSGSWTHLAFRALPSLHAIATLDHIGLQAYRTSPPVQLEEQAAGIAQHGAEFVPTP